MFRVACSVLFLCEMCWHFKYLYIEADVVKKKYHNCTLQRTKNDSIPDAGIPRNIRAECKYNRYIETFYYELHWDHPTPTQTPLSRYRVYIRFLQSNRHLCFQLPPYQRKLDVNKTVGFEEKTDLEYSITAQPVLRVHHDTMKKASACPISPRLKELGNKVVQKGQNFSFKCLFFEEPVPKPMINWFFSKDKTNCKKRDQIMNGEDKILSKNKRVLKIIDAKKEHAGCYVITAKNWFGDTVEKRGYLDVNETQVVPPNENGNFWKTLGPLFGLILGTTAVIVVPFMLIMYKCFWNPSHKPLISSRLDAHLKTKVYISHCSEDEKEKLVIAKFANIIKTYCIDVILDVCSAVQIDLEGGFSQWIPHNMNIADKVMVILTPSYVEALKHKPKDGLDINESICKVHSEYNHINNILYNDLHYSKKVLLISKGVLPCDFPYVFKNKFFRKFPEKLDIDHDLDFRSIIGVLLDEEPLQLQNGSPHVLMRNNNKNNYVYR